MINGELAAAIMHKLKLEQEVWNVSIFPNEALGSAVITVLSQIMSGKKHLRASLACFGMGGEECQVWAGGGKFCCSHIPEPGCMWGERGPGVVLPEGLGTVVVPAQWSLHHVEGSWGMKPVFGLGAFPKQYRVPSLCPLGCTTCVPGKGKARGKTPVNCRCGVKCLESTERIGSANPSHCLIKFKMKGLTPLPVSLQTAPD